MKTGEIKELFKQFEQAAHEFKGIECWSARELQLILAYSEWRNFLTVIDKAKESCKNAGETINYHFVDVNKVIEAGKGAQHEIEDVALTRYACYLIAQNGDSRKEQIAFAQNYFAVQTRRAEIVEKRILDYERLKARTKLAETEKNLSGIIYERGVNDKDFAIIRSEGDQALFRLSTAILKKKLNIPKDRPVADFLPTIGIKAKDLSAEMTSVNVQGKDLYGVKNIKAEHVNNNIAVRNMLLKRGIIPEKLSPAEDIKKVERKLKNDEISIEKISKKLPK